MKENERAVCAWCNEGNSVALFKIKDVFEESWEICHCTQCQAYFLSPKPTEEQLARAYSADYYGEGEEKFEGLIEKMLDRFRQGRAKRLARLMNNRGKLLDIGCGNGRFLQYVSQYGQIDMFGIEMAGGSANRAKRISDLNLKIGVLKDGDFEDSFFDAISMIHVFEHLSNPMKTMDIIDQILKPGAVLLLSFPNIDSIQARFFKGSWLHLDAPRHLFFFGPVQFKKLMKNRGYEFIYEKYFSPEYNPYGAQQSWLNRWLKKREILYEHLKGNHNYCKEYSQFNLLLQKSFVSVTFPLFVLTDIIASFVHRSATVELAFRKKSKS